MKHDKYLYREDFTQECIDDCTHQGACDADVSYWVSHLKFEVDQTQAREYLASVGAWSDEEIAEMSDLDVTERVFWIAMGDFKEGSDLVSLIG